MIQLASIVHMVVKTLSIDKNDNTAVRWLAAAMLFSLFSCSTVHQTPSPPQSGTDPLATLIKWYRGPLNHLSAVRHNRCPMVPSCSEYALQAIERHGPVKGWLLTCDRLLRCGREETDTAPRIWAHGHWHFYDPVENNDHLLRPQSDPPSVRKDAGRMERQKP